MNNDFDIEKLKKSWNEQKPTQALSRGELLLMLTKKSSNNIKYIVIFSVIEFLIVVMSLIFTSYTSIDSKIIEKLDADIRENYILNSKIAQVLSCFNVVISIGFIYLFYKSYRKINVLNTPKEFIQNILQFKKSVTWFIGINILIGIINFFLTGFYDFIAGFMDGYNSTVEGNHIPKLDFNTIHPLFSSYLYILLFFALLFFALLIGLIYYYLVYGILLGRLKRNLKALKTLENEE
ncbi:MAG: hypothetical protein LBT29_06565 [Flavobacteriaceae bacterium]|jgi:hypothetical protein|nr:hypothetical protein [Flavobacteriaceae bacterium]